MIIFIFQVQAEIMVTKVKDAFIIYSQAGKSLILRVWGSTPCLQTRDICKEVTIKLSLLIENTKIKILEVADFRSLYYTLLNVFSKKCNS